MQSTPSISHDDGTVQHIRELLEDAEDLRSLRSSKVRQHGAARTSLAEMKRLLAQRKRIGGRA